MYSWDLGMDMPYKQSLGSQLIARQEFVTLIHTLRTIPERNATETTTTTTTTTTSTSTSLVSLMRWPIQQWTEPMNCRTVIDAISTLNHLDDVAVGKNTTTATKNDAILASTATSTTIPALRPLKKKQRKRVKEKEKSRMETSKVG